MEENAIEKEWFAGHINKLFENPSKYTTRHNQSQNQIGMIYPPKHSKETMIKVAFEMGITYRYIRKPLIVHPENGRALHFSATLYQAYVSR